MKWITSFCLVSLCLMPSLSAWASSSASSMNVEKIELIKSELSYCRYIAWQARHKNLNYDDAVEWMDGILQVVLKQIEENDDQQ